MGNVAWGCRESIEEEDTSIYKTNSPQMPPFPAPFQLASRLVAMDDETNRPISFIDMKPSLMGEKSTPSEQLSIDDDVWSEKLTNVDLERQRQYDSHIRELMRSRVGK